jgi:hypothetical protein
VARVARAARAARAGKYYGFDSTRQAQI